MDEDIEFMQSFREEKRKRLHIKMLCRSSRTSLGAKPRCSRHSDSHIPQSIGIPSRRPPHRLKRQWHHHSPDTVQIIENISGNKTSLLTPQ